MADDPNRQMHFVVGSGEEGEMRVQALRDMAADAGFWFMGRPSISRWMQHLADEKISKDGIGYYAVLRRGSGKHYLVFLAQCPVRGPGKRVQVRTADGSVETWANSRYLRLVSEDGARAMLREHGVEIGDDEPIVRGQRYVIWTGEPTKRVAEGETRKVIHIRFGELLAEKRRRDERRWSYREISLLTGVHDTVVRRYALDRVTQFDVRALDGLCGFLHCTIDELLVIEEEVGP